MDRRKFLFVSAAMVLAPGSIANTMRLGQTPYGQAIRVFVNNPERITQQCPEWCWAASIAMIFADAGHAIDQQTIVQATYGQVVCASSGNTNAITHNLSQQWTDESGNTFQPTITGGYDFFNRVLNIDNNFIVNELANNRPLLYCNTHHCMVVVSCDFIATPMGPNIQGVGVIDPWPYSPEFHPLMPAEIMPAHRGGQMTYLASVDV